MRRLSFLVCLTPGGPGAKTSAVETVIVSCWRESAGIVRGQFEHPHSGISAYFQGTSELLALVRALCSGVPPSAGSL